MDVFGVVAHQLLNHFSCKLKVKTEGTPGKVCALSWFTAVCFHRRGATHQIGDWRLGEKSPNQNGVEHQGSDLCAVQHITPSKKAFVRTISQQFISFATHLPRSVHSSDLKKAQRRPGDEINAEHSWKTPLWIWRPGMFIQIKGYESNFGGVSPPGHMLGQISLMLNQF